MLDFSATETMLIKKLTEKENELASLLQEGIRSYMKTHFLFIKSLCNFKMKVFPSCRWKFFVNR